ncbi:MAG: tetratricopeptide repeat protein [Sedimentisphaerales bacterium]
MCGNEDFNDVLKLAEQGNVISQSFVGWKYATGKGVTQDYQEAFKWYKKAAEQGMAEAQYCMACMYANGKGVAQDYQEAANWCKKAAEQHHASAQLMLAEMYQTGQGVATNHIAACKWATLSTIQTIQNNVGLWLNRSNVWLIVLFVIAWFIFHNIWWGKMLWYVLLGVQILWVLGGISFFLMLIGLPLFYLATFYVFIKRRIFRKPN